MYICLWTGIHSNCIVMTLFPKLIRFPLLWLCSHWVTFFIFILVSSLDFPSRKSMIGRPWILHFSWQWKLLLWINKTDIVLIYKLVSLLWVWLTCLSSLGPGLMDILSWWNLWTCKIEGRDESTKMKIPREDPWLKRPPISLYWYFLLQNNIMKIVNNFFSSYINIM